MRGGLFKRGINSSRYGVKVLITACFCYTKPEFSSEKRTPKISKSLYVCIGFISNLVLWASSIN